MSPKTTWHPPGLEIDARDFPEPFQRVANFGKEFMRGKSWHSLVEPSASAFDRSWADLLPVISYLERTNELIGILDEAVEEDRRSNGWAL